MKKLAAGLTVTTLAVVLGSPTSAGPVDCSDFPEGPVGTHGINTEVDSDVEVTEDIICRVFDTVKGNIRSTGGRVVVDDDGVVEGNIIQNGDGTPISGGTLVSVTVRDGGIVEGNIIDKGDGNVNIGTGADAGNFGRVDGNIVERGQGSVFVRNASTINGNIDEQGDGSVSLRETSTVNGNVQEKGAGDVNIESGASVNGNVAEKGSGDCTVDGTVSGNLKGGCG